MSLTDDDRLNRPEQPDPPARPDADARVAAEAAAEADADDARARWQGEGRVAPPRPRSPPTGVSGRVVTPRRERRWLAFVWIGLAALTGGGARWATADWGLPYALHVDEKGFVVHEALAAEYRGLTQGDYRPHNTSYGPLVFELVIATKWVLFGGPAQARALALQYSDEGHYVGGALQTESSPTSVSLPALLYALRGLAAALGALAIWWLGLAAAQLETARTGVYAAWLAAVSVGLIQVGHFYTPESLLLPALAWFLYACAKLATEPPRLRSLLRAGLAIAFIAGTKAPGLVCLGALPAALAAHARVFHEHTTSARRARALLRATFSAPMGLALLIAGLAFAALNPWLVSGDPAEYFRDVAPNRSGAALLALQFTEREFSFYDWRFVYSDGVPGWPQLRTLLPYAVGGPACVAGYVALARGLRRRSPLDRIALWTALPPVLLVAGFAVATLRYVLPAVPGLILAAASLLAHPPLLAVGPRWLRRVAHHGLSVLGVLVLAWAGARGLAYASMFRQLDPRVLAGRYLAEHSRPGDAIVVEPEGSYSAVLNDNYDTVGQVDPDPGDDDVGGETALTRHFRAAAVPPLPPGSHVRRLFRARPDDEALPGHLAATLSRARFVVVGDWYSRRARHPSAARRAPLERAFYDDLFAGRSGFRVAARFTRAPRFPDTDWGYTWDEQDEEALSVCFDHMPVTIFERAPHTEPSDPSNQD